MKLIQYCTYKFIYDDNNNYLKTKFIEEVKCNYEITCIDETIKELKEKHNCDDVHVSVIKIKKHNNQTI